MIAVRDHGPGIPEDVLPHVFDRFYKASASRPRSEGSGLGLSIAMENAHIHGGDITAANSPEGGAVFVLRLPLDATPARRPPRRRKEARRSERTTSTGQPPRWPGCVTLGARRHRLRHPSHLGPGRRGPGAVAGAVRGAAARVAPQFEGVTVQVYLVCGAQLVAAERSVRIPESKGAADRRPLRAGAARRAQRASRRATRRTPGTPPRSRAR